MTIFLPHMTLFRRLFTLPHLLPIIAAFAVAFSSGSLRAVDISETSYEGRPHFKIVTESATWFYDKAGGGFSRLIDRDGRDWIAFKKQPLREFPASAAAGYRGMPNCVFRSADAGAGHPGFDRCESAQVDAHSLRTISQSGRWQWTWHFYETHARMVVERVDSNHAYWFLYEGPIAGKWSPSTHYFGSNRGGPRREQPDDKNVKAIHEHWDWMYCGDDGSPRVLFAHQSASDDLTETYYYLGSTPQGLESPDGMVVFGFGRGPGAQPLLKESGREFIVGFLEKRIKTAADHQALAEDIESLLHESTKLPLAGSLRDIGKENFRINGGTARR